jgi:ribosomal protein eS8
MGVHRYPSFLPFLILRAYLCIVFCPYSLKGIQQDSRHKRRATGGKRASYRKHRKFLLGRQAAHTKLGETRVRAVRVRGGNTKLRALRLDSGIFSWGAEGIKYYSV